ncbi:hypothetical protein M422DRAFT_775516 [Sphaerobolus stellatus SS14]|uniref:Uncharacterized protein n=1 Tax=Sphaerobolus stellatus (strain SS14) TaxID=990650 RepID=A0A0C9T845_SPHS4|nr:hypothetical protein M422DRAFT_785670 [Sphaerobolus stellatus SS14]KIJ54391.1 hypothetical protein M422DRAFT_775516 [Sphaerobolus stellatus SS14]
MVQGTNKTLQKKTPSRAQQKKPVLKKGQRVIAPKKAAAIKHVTLQKSLSAKINTSVERQMATVTESRGKLTIVKSAGTGQAGSSSTKSKR